MNAVGIFLRVMCLTCGVYAVPAHDEEMIFDMLVGLIDADIFEANNLTYKHVEFERPDSESLERVFRNRFDLFLGVPREILTFGLDFKDDADFDVLNKFSGSNASSSPPMNTKTSRSPPIPFTKGLTPQGNRTYNDSIPSENTTNVKYSKTVPMTEASDTFSMTTACTAMSNITEQDQRTFGSSPSTLSTPESTTVGGRSGDSAVTMTTGQSNSGSSGTPPQATSDVIRDQRPAMTTTPTTSSQAFSEDCSETIYDVIERDSLKDVRGETTIVSLATVRRVSPDTVQHNRSLLSSSSDDIYDYGHFAYNYN